MGKTFTHAITGAELFGAQEDYLAAEQRDRVRVGREYVFFMGFSMIKAIPLKEIVWAYMRQEDSRITLCCGKGTLPTYYLMLLTVQSEVYKKQIEREQQVKGLLDLLIERNPDIAVGYFDEHIKRFMGTIKPA